MGTLTVNIDLGMPWEQITFLRRSLSYHFTTFVKRKEGRKKCGTWRKFLWNYSSPCAKKKIVKKPVNFSKYSGGPNVEEMAKSIL